MCLHLQQRTSETYWGQLEEAASCARVMKVKVEKMYSDRASRILATGFSKNQLLRKVELGVSKELATV